MNGLYQVVPVESLAGWSQIVRYCVPEDRGNGLDASHGGVSMTSQGAIVPMSDVLLRLKLFFILTGAVL